MALDKLLFREQYLKKANIDVMANTKRMMTTLMKMRFPDQERKTANSCAIILEF